MTTAANYPPGAAGRSQVGSRRIFLIATSVGGAILTGGFAVYLWLSRLPAEVPSSWVVPDPPSIGEAADPAVAKRLAESRAAVGQHPQSAAAWGSLGMAFFVHDFSDEANVCFAVAERLDPLDARWSYFQGVIRAESDPDSAMRKLERAADLCGDTPDAPRLQLAELLLAHGRLDKAAEQFHYILRRNPTNARAHLGLGRLAFMRGDLLQSQAHLGLSVGNPHTQKASHLLFAQIHGRLGSKAIAESEYRRAASAQDDPAWPDLYLEDAFKLQTGKKTFLIRANVLLEQGRLDACVAECRKMVHDYPDSHTIWLILGKALIQQRDLPAAQEAFQRVLRLAPDSVEAHFQLGYASYLRRDYRVAATWYRKATELKPDFTFAYHDLGHCLILLGDRAGAIEAFRTALRCQPDLAEVHRMLGELLANNGEHAEAFAHARLALQFNPADATAKKLMQRLLIQITIPTGP